MLVILLSACVVAGLLSIFVISLPWLKREYANLPPGPTPLPFLGSLLSLGTYPHRSLANLSKAYGPILTIWISSKPAIVVSSIPLAEQILKVQDVVCASRTTTYRLDGILSRFRDIVFSPNNDGWKKLRRLALLHVVSTRQLAAWAEERQREVKRMVAALEEAAENAGGKPLELRPFLLRATLNNIMLICAGKRYVYPNQTGPEFAKQAAEADHVQSMVLSFLETLGQFVLIDIFPFLEPVDPQGAVPRAKKLSAQFESYLGSVIRERRELLHNSNATSACDPSGVVVEEKEGYKREGRGGVGGEARAAVVGSEVLPSRLSFLDVLLDLEAKGEVDEEEMFLVLQDMMVAGSDTTSATTEWALAELASNPDMLARVQEEVDTCLDATGQKLDGSSNQLSRLGTATEETAATGIDAAHCKEGVFKLPYLEAVIKETLRRHPIAPLLITHENVETVQLGQYVLPPKTLLLVNWHSIGHDPSIWEDPFTFQPARFLPPNQGIDVKGHDFRMLPFGSGRRRCIGVDLALDMMTRMIAGIVRSFDLVVTEPVDLTERPGLSLPLAKPLRPVLRKRARKVL